MKKKRIGDYFKRRTIGLRILILTLVYLVMMVSMLSPFILIEGSSRVLAIILVAVVSTIYVFALLIYIWDWIKKNYQSEDDNKNEKE